MGELNFCTLADIFKTAYEQLINDLSLDLHLPYFISRLFHNRLFFLIVPSLRCYILYFDMSQLVRYVPRILIPFILYAFWEKRFRKVLFSMQLLLPFFFIVNPFNITLGSRIYIFGGYYSLIGLLGAIKLFTREKKR